MMDLETIMQGIMSSPAGLITWLIDYALKGSIILVVALILTVFLRKQSASSRHLILGSAFLGILLLPLFSLAVPSWQISILPELKMQGQALTSAADFNEKSNFEGAKEEYAEQVKKVDGTDTESRPDSRPDSAGENSGTGNPSDALPVSRAEVSEDSWLNNSTGILMESLRNNWSLLAMILWLGIGLPILIWLLVGVVQISIIVRSAKTLDDNQWTAVLRKVSEEIGVSVPVRLVASNRIKYPLAWGIVRPTIVLPLEAEGWSGESIRIVLLHELSHVKRGDILIQFIALLARPFFWFNPLVWYASNRLQKEQEFACDDLVLESGIKPSDYALELLEIAGMLKVTVNWAAATMAKQSEVKGRIMSILNPDVNRKAVSRLIAAIAGIVTLLTLLPVASAHIWSKPQAVTLPGEPYNSESGQIGQYPQDRRDKPARRETAESRPVVTARSIKAKIHQDDSQLDLDNLITQLGSSDPEERAYAAFLLGRMGSKASKAVPALVKLLGDDTEIVVHFEWRGSGSRSIYSGDTTPGHMAGSALGNIGSAAFDAVIPVLASDNAHARENAVRALRGIGDRRALVKVRPMVTDENTDVRQIVIRTMREMQDEGNIEYLAKAVSDVEPEVRILAIRTLREFGNVKATQAVFPALKDKNVEARKLAVRTVRENMTPAAVEALKSSLTDEDLEIRELALRALREFQDKSSVPVINSLLKDPERSIRLLAIRTLREMRNPSSIKPLMEALSYPDKEMRELVLRTLREFGGPEIVPAVITALDDDDAAIRELAIRTLREVRDKRAVQPLSQLHSDPNPENRELALRALREQGDTATFEMIVVFLNDEEDPIRELAIRALRELGDKRAADYLIKIIQDDPNSDIRKLAARALSELDL